MGHYKITEADIDGVIHYMEAFHPERANREYCRRLLEFLQNNIQMGFHDIAGSDPEAFEAMVEKFNTSVDAETKS